MINKKINFANLFTKANFFSLILVILSLIFVIFKGLNFGIDFKGGTLMEIRADKQFVNSKIIRDSLKSLDLGDVNVKKFGKEGDFLIKIEEISNNKENSLAAIKQTLKENISSEINFRRIENVGPKVSGELLKSGIIAITLSLIAMLFYIWIRFEWQFSLGSIVALFHDVSITVGIFSLLGIEVNLSIVAALLTIIGYSMNDTVVIYDRIRENLKKFNKLTIEETANLSINETLSRTFITSITTLLALFSIFFLGGQILKGFSFAMILGVIIGTYSSIFVASPVLKYLKVSYKTLEKEETS
jgi:preprotein translocase subunit SecF